MSIQVDSKWNDIINYIGLKDEHLELLHDQKAFFEKYANEVVIDFYSRVLKNDSLSNIVLEFSTFDRLTKSQIIYFNHLFSRNIDYLYIMFVQKIGSTHFRIGLNPEWFLAGVNVYLDGVYKLCSQLDNGLDIYHAFAKRILFDTKVCLDQYDQLRIQNKII
ncbi:hypothetical protein M670_02015 [Schinkia azotoformans MEV2011]|uniref:Globin-sensor domain-containing protein n=1 Tax=Schinkia azotoformans MEV2011 TaxID=1348973 RepID=A0A072NMW8_SCHAZ|nr:protoglobin domain-containing protein [Schinkia azotoformans]KEF38801.1 hypothetical protein M670_02015 [Schinkia azotoformans MEV2011]MEC1693960.1 protoglobin domain-containing protein [Schinkia azotoformans]MEC1714216.1 protoglobin domain-containing protein [Schinkia azotoformans]MEC1724579.1 protoglobin domain-containing protein [Schinkia azotoformans]MEC1742431.1 protoglobin domain-containing protein [Schinkia azotoformans]